MNDQLVSLSKIFTERLFRIPDYQRGYSWATKEISDFFNDLIRLKDDKSHYVGVLTLEPAHPDTYVSWVDDLWLIKSRKYQPYYVVDGQQRLTTSSIFLVSLLEEAKKRNLKELNFTPLTDIEKQFLFIEKQDTRSKSYLFSYELDNPSYDFLLTKIFMQKSVMDTSFDETSYTKNLEVAKQFFIDKLRELPDEVINTLFYKVTQNFKFNIYEINSDIDVFVTFETMNNRGKPLSHLELLKNRLIYISTLLKDDPDVISRLRRDINACWRDIYHYLGRNRERLLPDDEFLSSHFYLYFNKEIDNDPDYSKFRFRSRIMLDNGFQQYYLLEKVFIPENVEKGKLGAPEILDYISSLKSAITVWNAINNPLYSDYRVEITKLLLQINHFLNIETEYNWRLIQLSTALKTFLLAYFEQKYEEKKIVSFLKTLERYLFIDSLYPEECFKEDKKRFDFLKEATRIRNKEENLSDISEKLEKLISSLTSSSDVNSRMIKFYSRYGFYRARFMLTYFLFEYENYLFVQSKNTSPRLDYNLLISDTGESIEHIYPQNPHCKEWTEPFKKYTNKQKQSLRNSLGNFVLLSEPKNGKLGNKPFEIKKGNPENTVGYRYGSYAEIKLCEYDKWEADEILNRGLLLLRFMEQRWDLKIGTGTKQEKYEFLGLSFLLSQK